MVTPAGAGDVSVMEFKGLSTDEKPTSCGVNSLFLELDTSKMYYFHEGEWTEVGKMPPVLLYENDEETLFWNNDEGWHKSGEVQLGEELVTGSSYRITIGEYTGTAVAADGEDYPYAEYWINDNDSIGVFCTEDAGTVSFVWSFIDTAHDDFVTNVKLERIE